MAEIYSDFAYVYDEFMDTVPYAKWCERIAELIREHGVSRPVRGAGAESLKAQSTEVRSLLDTERDLVVDLGCGTGTLTQLLYDKGYDMIGVDVSEEMLNIAMNKREKTGAEILYLLQDMRELELYSTVGTVVSICDSINYILEEEELLDVFQLVENYLYPGGVFVFDFNTVYKYEQVIGNTTIAENRDDCSFIWENYYYPDEEINEYDLTVFVRKEEDLFRRFTENHLQRGYTVEKMVSLAEAAGLQVVLVEDFETGGDVTDTTERVCIVAKECRKKNG